jgi:hypothetical protein
MIQYRRQSQLRYNNNKQLFASLVLGIIILLFGIFSTAITSPSSYLSAQQQQQQMQNGTTTTTSSATSVGIGVKITSPARDQQVPVGSLKISGTSTDNATSNDCTVYALWDDLKPYQKVEPTGPSGTDDYSNWTFTYTSAYHLITNGTNQLTAKISCLASPSSSSTTTVGSSSSSNLTKWYSINVTGMPINQTSNTAPTAASTRKFFAEVNDNANAATGLVVTDTNMTKNQFVTGGQVNVFGHVVNLRPQGQGGGQIQSTVNLNTARMITVIATFFDKDNLLIKAQDAAVDPNTLGPGQGGTFHLIVNDIGEIDHVLYLVQWLSINNQQAIIHPTGHERIIAARASLPTK